ncbi:zinc ribbon domain-containing protein [Brachyspira aalborgi]|uniref:Zinc ribbon domain-containing protein n=1 Tax=Brachyspira aalborgi TaxID=29522 RepID=A0A5C8ELQ2_9SPIR|nr:zinc ribbon domain-containing protein [Brachyspira aalborgi]TXJ37030.1 zinc ribbon domain-containing protein [Brachyspira aalborgi]TXJ49206.1 zinc ribbon domain-containing protein [Brachyspira aalborgi]
MICKSCGKELENDYKACPYCGAKTEEGISGEKVCPYCGKLVKGDFKICPYCENKIEIISQKNGVVCLILLFSFILFPPLIWSHRFYAGKIGSTILLLLSTIMSPIFIFLPYSDVDLVTAILYIIGLIIGVILLIIFIKDFIQIISGNFKDSEGKCIKIKK